MGVVRSNEKFSVRFNRLKDAIASVWGHVVFGLFVILIVIHAIDPLYIFHLDIKKDNYESEVNGYVSYVMNETDYYEYLEDEIYPRNFYFVVGLKNNGLVEKFYFSDGRVKSYYEEGSIQTLYVRTYIAIFIFMVGLFLLTVSRLIWLCDRSFLVSSEYKKPGKIELLTMIYGLSLMISAFIVGG